jgi:hypothetical protein
MITLKIEGFDLVAGTSIFSLEAAASSRCLFYYHVDPYRRFALFSVLRLWRSRPDWEKN